MITPIDRVYTKDWGGHTQSLVKSQYFPSPREVIGFERFHPLLRSIAMPAKSWILAFLWILLSWSSRAADSLQAGFASVPADARPETWFHLIGGNVAKPGLTADLEAVAEAGFDGIQLFHGQFGGPWPGVTPQVVCLSSSWDDMIGHVADECGRLGLHFTMQNCPGWAMSGGPWIKPENAMRHLVCSRAEVTGGTGPIQLSRPEPSKEPWRDYRDVAVLAFPTPSGSAASSLMPVEIRSNREKLAWTDLIAGKSGVSVKVEPGEDPVWIEVFFDQEVTLRSLDLPGVEKLAMRRCFDPGASIRVQAMGPHGLAEGVELDLPRSNWQDDQELTLALPDAKARGFRITFKNRTPLELSLLRFSSAARIHDWQGQAGFVLRSLNPQPPVTQDPASWISSESIMDLTPRMQADGKLDWEAPQGSWTILRFGHVNTGARNGPAPKEATGFECDKLSSKGAEAHFAGYIGRLSSPGAAVDGGRLQGMVIDSWECHTQTWTAKMQEEFQMRRGYGLRSWMPALVGWVVGDPATSQRFLRDWRATLNDLLVTNYYGRLAALGRERGMRLSFESGPGDVPTGDILQYYGQADIPMCEFWHPNDPHWGGLETKPMLPAVSAAHLYGKKKIAAEAFTNIDLRWNEHPFMLKHLADRHFAMGLNHLVFHTYTHNPRLDVVPGSSFGAGIGTPFLRGQTWWKHMPQFTDYIARCSFMLGRGEPVSDVLWYLGDTLDHKPRQDEPFPDGYRYDYLNSDVLQNRLSVAGGLLKSPEGVVWKIISLPNRPALTANSLARLRDLVRQGAKVVGMASAENPSLVGGEAEDRRFRELHRELWGAQPAATGDCKLGLGRLLWGMEMQDALLQLGIRPDVMGAGSCQWFHRHDRGTDLYFLAADRKSPLASNLSFRSEGVPEFWDPLTGKTKSIQVYHRQGEHTVIPIQLPAAGSVFVVFRPGRADYRLVRVERDNEVLIDAADASRVDRTRGQSIQGLKPGDPVQPWVENPLPDCEVMAGGKQLLAWKAGSYRLLGSDRQWHEVIAAKPKTQSPEGPCTLSFPSGWGAPSRMTLPRLQSWTDLEDSEAKVFSGSASYEMDFNLDVPLEQDQRLMVDLGRVEVIADMELNGKPLGVLWAPPFRADLTPHLQPGANRLIVTVTSTWHNRLAHDEGLPENQRKTWTVKPPASKTRLTPAGWIGPVKFHFGQVVDF